MTSWQAHLGAAPLYATHPDPSRPNEGAQIAAVARSLGTPLLPWQRYVADVASERNPDGSYAYETVIVSVPRQTGKTTLIHSMGVHRAGVLGRDVHYTAQTGKDARARWTDAKKKVEKSAVWRGKYDVTLRGGAECITFHGNAGFHAFAPVEDGLHGYTPATVVLDEAFAHDAHKGEMLMGAIGPAQLTILAKQVWIVSTMGTADSTFLHDWIDTGMQREPRVALFLWAAEDDDDVYDLDTIARFHPGVGFRLNEKILTAQDVLSEVTRVKSRAEYERAFGNRRTPTTNNLIPLADWRALGPQPDLGVELTPPADNRSTTLAYVVAADRRSSSIVAAWPTPAGKVGIKVVQAGPGTSWLPDAVHNLATTWRPRAVRAVGHGPTLAITRDVVDLGVAVEVITDRQYSATTAAFLNAVDDAEILHDGSPVLELSVTGLATRSSGPDGKAFSGELSAGDESAGIAAALAFAGADTKVTGKPVLEFS